MAESATKLRIQVVVEGMITAQPNRILTVEIRADRAGYAVFEKPMQLIDFGASWFGSPATARCRFARLLTLHLPSVLVLRNASPRYRQKLRRSLERIACDEARKLGIYVARIPERSFRSYCERQSCRTKYDVARLLGKFFPEIAWRVPLGRKSYQPEPRSMLYFDSIAVGVAFLESWKTKDQGEVADDENLFAGPSVA
jgi:hypothetical protein